MNSALQLLLRIPFIQNYLTNLDIKMDVNYSNSMGQNGKVSKAFFDLYHGIVECRNNKKDSYNPKIFKAEIGKVWTIFKGRDQQDSQELLTLILNALSEELTLLKSGEKYTCPEYSIASDLNDISLQTWSQYIYNSWSFISFGFTGILCSHITCSECANASYNFEPFISLSLTIPETKRMEYTVYYTKLDTTVKAKLATISNIIDTTSNKQKLKIVSEKGPITYLALKKALIDKFVCSELKDMIEIQLSETYGTIIWQEDRVVSSNYGINAIEMFNAKSKSLLLRMEYKFYEYNTSIYIRLIYKCKLFIANQYNFEVVANNIINLPSVIQ